MTERLALFDPEVILTLAGNLGSSGLAFGFLGDYLELLPSRKHRIINALRDEDPEAAMDAILSLKITSAMVGAHDAEDRCRVLQVLVTSGHLQSARLEATALGVAIDTLFTESSKILSSMFAHLDGSPNPT